MPGNLDLPSLIFKIKYSCISYTGNKKKILLTAMELTVIFCGEKKKTKGWVLVMVFSKACNIVLRPELSPL